MREIYANIAERNILDAQKETEPLPTKVGRFGLLLKQPKVVVSSLISFST